MDEKVVKDVLVLMKRTGNLLNEVEDLTRQIGQSVDRNDRVSTEMLLAMREEPLQSLEQNEKAIRDQLDDQRDPDVLARLRGMLNGGPPSEESQPMQKLLCDQVAANHRRLKLVQDLDRQVSQRLARDQSVYR